MHSTSDRGCDRLGISTWLKSIGAPNADDVPESLLGPGCADMWTFVGAINSKKTSGQPNLQDKQTEQIKRDARRIVPVSQTFGSQPILQEYQKALLKVHFAAAAI